MSDSGWERWGLSKTEEEEEGEEGNFPRGFQNVDSVNSRIAASIFAAFGNGLLLIYFPKEKKIKSSFSPSLNIYTNYLDCRKNGASENVFEKFFSEKNKSIIFDFVLTYKEKQ